MNKDKNKDMNKDDMNKQDMSKEMEKKPDDMNGKKSDMMPMGGMMDPPPMGGNEEPKGRRPRQQQGEPKDKDGQPKDPGGNQQQPMTAQPKDPKNPGGARPDPMSGDPKNAGRSLLPFEDEIVKDVWGHLPDKLRQQATQYYRQEFMPRYTELLKLYYSSLAEKK
jgi:hypothetical protein